MTPSHLTQSDAKRTPRKRARRGTSLTSRVAAPVAAADADHLLDTHAAAAFLGVAPRTLYKWAAQGRLPVIRLGRSVRFRMSALRALVQEHEEPATIPLAGAIGALVGAGTEPATLTRP